MTVLAILGSVAAIIVAMIRIWNTDTVSGQRYRAQCAVRDRRERKALRKRIEIFASEPALVQSEARFNDLVEAYEAKRIPHDLRLLWAQVFRLAGVSPVGRPLQYGALEVHQEMIAMTVRKGSASVTGREWLEVHPISLSPRLAIKPSNAPIPVIKE